ncbi:MAG: ATP-binding protein [Parachlamydiaceae bacterium]
MKEYNHTNHLVNDTEHEILIPDASPVIHSLRAIGYIPETAIADLLDNSLDAKAKVINVSMIWDEERSFVRIEDNGSGMDEKTLVQAMRLGSKNPLDNRNEKELGRFGMGLKTASFSLGKRLTVLTKRNGKEFVRCWDLDTVKNTNEWKLRKQAYDESRSRLGSIQGNSGTVVLIEKLDRLILPPYDKRKQNKFYRQVDNLEKHLRLVFHRFLEGPHRIQIVLNGNSLSPWDPFFAKITHTHEMSKEDLMIEGKQISIEGYILPHHSKLTKEQYLEAGGANGWFDHQGFYIYRNKRLLLAGGWLNLFPKEESAKLARIRVDISQDADFDWQIDVKKSVARPPQEVVDHLQRWGEKARNLSRRIYYHRSLPSKNGSSSAKSEELEFLWEQSTRNNKPYFVIHRENTLLTSILEQCSDNVREQLEVYLKMLQEFCPINTIAFAPPVVQSHAQNDISTEHKKEMQKISKLYRQMNISLEETAQSLKAMPIFTIYELQDILNVIQEDTP